MPRRASAGAPAAAARRVSADGCRGRPRRAARRASRRRSGRCPSATSGADPGFDATYHIKLCDLGRTWEVRCTTARARGSARAPPGASPDVTISTDAETWLRLREGEFSGIDAFQRRPPVRARQPRLRGRLRGHVPPARRPPAAAADPRRPGRPPPHLDADDGQGPDVLLLHGLGGTRASFFETAAALSRHYRVHAPDLPGLRLVVASPRSARYNARWFAESMLGLMDELGIERGAPRRQLDGRPGRDRDRRSSRPSGSARSGCCARRSPGSGAACIRSSACCDPSSACSPTASAARRSPPSSGASSTTATRSTPRSAT